MFKSVIKEQLKVPAHVDYLGELRDFVTRVCRKYGVSDKVINAFKLAIDEAGTNIIRHAYRDHDEPGFVTVRVIVKKASVTVSLIDQGKYFDPRNVKDPDLKRYVEIGKRGGLGIFIIRKLMDELDYRKTEEGNELRMTKNRVAEGSKKGVKPIIEAVHSVPLSLKAQYFIRSATIITLAIVAVYAFLFYKNARLIEQEYFSSISTTGQIVLRTLLNENSQNLLEIPLHDEISQLLMPIFEENKDIVHEIIVTDTLGEIYGHRDFNMRGEEFPGIPADAEIVAENIALYKTKTKTENDKVTEIEVYDYHVPIVIPSSGEKFGELHVQLDKAVVDAEIFAQRMKDARFYAAILLLSYVGTFFLIYILLNPFKKLASWVRAIDHGEVEDEMDIDSSTEIGEIAKAFSEMTNKFRESQKNLAEQERLQKEMQVAQEIQQTLLPDDFPELEGYELASYYQAAKEVGGDYYDFVEVDKDTLGIVVADVSGKGVPGSLVMTMIRTALRTEARGVYDAAEVLARVNDFVYADMKKGMFVTIFYVIIDSRRRRLNYASAGHNPMILYRPATQKTYYLNPKGFPIGIQLTEKDLFRKSIESDTIQLAEDDILLLYTDGITEAMNSSRDLFGEERLLNVLREYGHLRVTPFVEKLREELDSFTEGNIQYDDITLVAIKEKTTPEKEELRRAKLAHGKIAKGMSIREACEQAGITTYAYYNKYKKQFELHGVDSYEIDEDISVEAKHVSIEEKTKIFDIITNHPEYGAKRISEELNTEKYGFTVISESKIYDELVRSRLNTRQLREAFVARGTRTKRRIKPPGTPLLTLDGRVILDREMFGGSEKQDQEATRQQPSASKPEKPRKEDKPVEEGLKGVEITPHESKIKNLDVDMDVISTPIEDLLDKSKPAEDEDLPVEEPTSQEVGDPPDDLLEAGEKLGEEPQEQETQAESGFPEDSETVSFEQFFEGGTILADDEQETPEVPQAQIPDESPDIPVDDMENAMDVLVSEDLDAVPEAAEEPETLLPEANEPGFDAVDDLLSQEIMSSFSDETSSTVVEDDENDVSAGEAEEKTVPPLSGGGLEDIEELDQAIERTDEADDPTSALIGDETLEFLSYSTQNPEADSTKTEELTFDDFPKPLAQNDETEDTLKDEKVHDEPLSAQGEDQQDDTGIFLEIFSAADDGGEPVENANASITKDKPPESADRQKAGETDEDSSETPLENERELLLVEGLKYYKKKEYQKAIEQFRSAIEKYPDFKEAHSILGNAYFRTGKYDLAEQSYRQVLELDYTDTTARENMGVIHANRGELEKAIEQWEMVLEIDPDRTDIKSKIEKASRLLDEKATSAE